MILILIILVIILLLNFLIKPTKYWKERHVPTGDIIPLLGENYRNLIGKDCPSEFVERIYNKVSYGRYFGIYLFQEPVLVLKSPELIKNICVKNYTNVMNRHALTPDSSDLLMSKNLVGLKGQQWKDMRHILSPAFSPSKLKALHTLLYENANKTVQFYIEKKENLMEVLAKDVFTKFTNDSMANILYGLEINSFENEENFFYTQTKDDTDFSRPWKILVILIYQLCSKIAGLLRISLLGKNATDFYLNIVKQTINLRKQQNIERQDMLGILTKKRSELQKVQNEESEIHSHGIEKQPKISENYLSDEYIAANFFLLLIAGYDTTSTAMCFMAYELAINSEIQKNLINEIDENKTEGEMPSYETIVNMAYLDMVVSEVLRKWPSLAQTDRIVTRAFTIESESSGEIPIHLKPGDKLMIPIFGIHRDPKYYKNPDVFDPERFSPVNRKTIDPSTYMPFGVGPRNCIAMRLAILKVKVIFFHLLSHFEIVPTARTEVPPRLKRTVVTLTEENGFPLAFKRRFPEHPE